MYTIYIYRHCCWQSETLGQGHHCVPQSQMFLQLLLLRNLFLQGMRRSSSLFFGASNHHNTNSKKSLWTLSHTQSPCWSSSVRIFSPALCSTCAGQALAICILFPPISTYLLFANSWIYSYIIACFSDFSWRYVLPYFPAVCWTASVPVHFCATHGHKMRQIQAGQSAEPCPRFNFNAQSARGSLSDISSGSTGNAYTYAYIYIYGPVLRLSTPPPWVGSPGSSPNSLLFASYWQHFWGPAAYLLGLCSISDYQPRIY